MLDVASSWLRRAEWQRALFADEPRRVELLKLEPVWPCRPFRLRVHRNQAFEFIATVLSRFLAFAARDPKIAYSDYDDSLVMRVDGAADVELVWMDFERYRERLTPAALVSWIQERVQSLRTQTDSPILIADCPAPNGTATELNEGLRRLAQQLPGVRLVPISQIAAQLGARTFDPRASKVTGMPYSDVACVLFARALGLVWLPAVLASRLKAIVLDLDNTLYSGVLGEDGPAGVKLSPDHLKLQRNLLRLRDEGVFLALASRNEPSDVERLFAERLDFPVRLEHFSAQSIAFRSKPAGVLEIAAALRISPDSMLFVDDNPGEIAAVAGEVPGISVLHALDAAVAARAVEMYPGLHGYPAGGENLWRVGDLAAAGKRAEAARAAQSPEEYLRSLEVVLTFATDAPEHLSRIAELSNKTNQFNTSFLRLSEAQVARRIHDPACRTISIALRDRLSDSGIVGVVFTRRDGATLLVEEIAVSCRALGRNIEHAMVTEALRRALQDLPAREVHFAFREGPRNGPARAFLTEYAGREPVPDGVMLAWDPRRAARRLAQLPVTIVSQREQ